MWRVWGREEERTGLWWECLRNGIQFEHLVKNDRIILYVIEEIRKLCWIGFNTVQGELAGCCEGGNGKLRFLKARKFFD